MHGASTPRVAVRTVRVPRLAGLLVASLVVALPSSEASATVEGVNPSKVGNWRIFGAHSATGAALMVPGPFLAEINSVLLSSATAELEGLPFDAEVVAAYLFWSGSLPRAPGSSTPLGPDRDVSFRTADGSSYPDLSVDDDLTGFGRCVTTAQLGGFYYCRRDVTELVRVQGVGNIEGVYEVGDVRAHTGRLDGSDVNAQAKYAGWSLVVVWESATEIVRRDVVLYDGFLRLDEVNTSPGVHTFNIGDFVVGSPALGKLTVFGLEGDRQLGVPPEDSLGCPTCFDFISFRASGAGVSTKLSNGSNPPNNSFNSSWNGQPSIDIDTYDLDGLIRTGDSAAIIQLGSGDGNPSTGNGESFFTGWLVMSIDTLTPKFKGAQTKKSVSSATASAGQRLVYVIDVANEGSITATNVTLTDAPPAGTTYVPGSTRVDGVVVRDLQGQSRLVGGLSLGNIPPRNAGDHTRQIIFEVIVDESACGGSVSNTAVVDSNETEPVSLGPVLSEVVVAPLDPPTKSVAFVSPGAPGPGSVVRYTIEVGNSSAVTLGGVEIRDRLPEYLTVDTVFTSSGTHTLSGRDLTVDGVTVNAGGSAQVVVVGRVGTVAELGSLGVAEDDIDGLVISNQASVQGGCTPPQLTDDPDVGGVQATEFALTYRPILATSSKAALDVNGGRLEPLDVVRFTIRAVNTGNRSSDVVVRDAIPANTTYVAGSTLLDGAAVADASGTSAVVAGLSLGPLAFAGDNDRVVTFDVRVDANAPNGASVVNTASLDVPAVPEASVQVSSPALVVSAAADFSTSVKTVTDLTAPVGTFEPGDEIEYAIRVRNSGTRAGTSVVVSDTLPAQLTFVSASGGGALAAGEVRWDVGAAPVNADLTLTVRARIVSPLDDGTVVSNSAVVSAAGVTPFTTPPATFTVESAPRLVVTKDDEHPRLPARPGDAVTYRIVVRNEGNMVARDVVVTDVLDASLTGASAPRGVISGSTVTWRSATEPALAAVAPGAPVELVLAASLRTPLVDGTVVSNRASASGAGVTPVLSDDPETSGPADPTTFAVSSSVTLSATKTVVDLTPATPGFQPGDRVRYAVRVSATGDAPARDVVITDELPAQLGAVTATRGVVSGRTVTWSAGTLDPGSTLALDVEATIDATVPHGQAVDNQARVTSRDVSVPLLSDGDGAVAGAQPTSFVVTSPPRLVFEKTVADLTAPPDVPQPGDEVEYTVTARNIGATSATNVTVTDAVASQLTATPPANATMAGGVITWSPATEPSLASIAAGQSVVLRFRAVLAADLSTGTVIANQAQLDATELGAPRGSDDPSTAAADDPTRLVVVDPGEIGLRSKVFVDPATGAVRSTARRGDALRIDITVRNDGGAALSDVRVEDVLDPDLLTTVVVRDGGVLSGSTARWTLATLAAGESRTLRIEGRVRDDAPAGEVLNQAFIGIGGPPNIPTDDPARPGAADPTRIVIDGEVELVFAKTVRNIDSADGAISPGDRLEYTLAISNFGNAPATAVSVRDLVDPAVFEDVTAVTPHRREGDSVVVDAVEDPALTAIDPGETVTLRFTARVRQGLANGTALANQAFIEAAELAAPLASDDPSTSAPADATVRRVRFLDLRVSKEIVGAAPAQPGGALGFAITVSNVGPVVATDVVVRDPLDALLVDASGAGAVQVGGELVWSASNGAAELATIAPGASVTLALEARVDAAAADGALISNQANVVALGRTFPSDWPLTPAALDPVVVEVRAHPSLTVSKSVGTTSGTRIVSPREELTYTFVVENSGMAAASDFELRDVLDPDLELLGTLPSAQLDGRRVTWSVASLAAGGSATFEMRVRVARSAKSGAEIINQARALGGNLVEEVSSDDPTTSEPGDPTRVQVISQPALGRTALTGVDLNGGMVEPGDVIRYELRVVNSGTSASSETRARLAVPPHTSYIAGSTLLNGEPIADLDGLPATASGLVVRSSRGDTPDGVLLPDDGAPPVDEAARVTFDVRVDARAVGGTVISAQASISSAEVPDSLSDDPASEAVLGDATVMVVGGGPTLAVRKSTAMVADAGAQGLVEAGDVLRYLITVANTGDGPARDAVLVDPVPDGATYVAGSMRLDGAPLTDAGNDDAGELSDQGVRVRLGDLQPEAAVVVSFDVQARGNAPLVNQATVRAGARSWRSDGDPAVLGEQATLTPVEGARTVADVQLVGVDLDGGMVEAGDRVRLSLTVHNPNAAALIDPLFSMVLPETLDATTATFESGAATQVQPGAPVWRMSGLDGGERLVLEVELDVAAGALPGELIEVTASLETAEAALAAEPLRWIVGGATGTGYLEGRVVHEVNEAGGALTASRPVGLEGFSVLVIPAGRLAESAATGERPSRLAVRTMLAGREGRFEASGLPAGRYDLVAVSPEGTQYSAALAVEVAAGAALAQDVFVDPSGIIYQDVDGSARPVAGAQVFLVDEATGEDLPATDLFGGQQGQVTTAQGFYRFDVRASALPGSFRLRVVPPGPTLFFPSASRPPEGAVVGNPFGEPAVPPPDGRIVPNDLPDLEGSTQYYLRFGLDLDSPNITNNHVPLDRLEEHLRVTKTASRRSVQVGDVITYTVTVVNPLPFEVGGDGAEPVHLVDDLPSDIAFVDRSARLVVNVAGQSSRAVALDVEEKSARNVVFEPMRLPASSTVTVRYYAVVGLRAKGEQENRARVVSAGNATLSNVGSAVVRVTTDPIFDEGTVLGRVFCDDDGDGALGPEEQGLPGARVYLDTGYYVDADLDGKFHFRGVAPGRHALKLDLNTVPPDSAPTTDVFRELLLTRGLLAKIDFGLRCGWRQSAAAVVASIAPAPERPAVVTVDPAVPAIALDGAVQLLPLVDAELTAADVEPRFDESRALNLDGPRKLVWHLQSASQARIAGWSISVFAADGREVWRVDGSGAPPPRVPWELADGGPLAAGEQYVYRVAVRTEDGAEGEGRWRRLGYRVMDGDGAASEGPLGTLRGTLFKEGTDDPAPQLRGELTRLWSEAQSKSRTPKLRLEVHSGGGSSRSANLLLTQRQAVAAQRILVELGARAEDVKAIGKGDNAPLMPNISRKARDMNARLVLSWDAPPAKLAELTSPAYAAYARVNGMAVPADVRSETRLRLRAGDEVVVELREANGRRVRVARRYPFDAAAPGERAPVQIPVRGKLASAELLVGEAPVPLPLLDSSCAALDVASSVQGGKVARPISFEVKAAASISDWTVRVFNPDGSILANLTGEGAPPQPLTWDGQHVRPEAGTYSYRCMLVDAAGNRFVSALRRLDFAASAPAPATTAAGGAPVESAPLLQAVLNKDAYPTPESLGEVATTELGRAAALVTATPGARVVIEVHDDSEGGKMQAQIRTARLASALSAVLQKQGVPESAIETQAHGANKPIMAGATKRARDMNRRVTVRVVAPPAPPAPPPSAPVAAPTPAAAPAGEIAAVRVRIAGQSIASDEAGVFQGTVTAPPDATLVVDVALGDGRSAIYSVPLFNARPVTGGEPRLPRAGTPSEATSLGAPPAALESVPPGAPAGTSLVTAGDGAPAATSELAGTPSAAPVSAGTPSAGPAACRAYVPAEGATLRGERLTVVGDAEEGVIVRVNGEVVPLDEDRRFSRTLALPGGEAKLEVACEAPDGAIAVLTRNLMVPDSEWFLLGLAEGAAGLGPTIDGMTGETLYELPNELYLHGRAVAYFKGRIKGSALLEHNPFSDVRVTAHVDTGKEPRPELLRQLIDPERYYPVYGDSSEEVQDISSRSKLYILVEADRSRLTFGNFNANLQGVELFQYQRTFFGGALELDHELIQGHRTEVKAFAADGESGVRHRHLVLQGTGGSMYFLRDDEILEGSERVEIVVRDEVSGARLWSVAQTRDVDYRIDYRDGRLVFDQPIPSVVDAGFRVNQNPLRTLDGHSVFVEVEYDFQGGAVGEDNEAFAFQARQTFGGRVTVGGGVVAENRDGTEYRLIGGEARFTILPQTHLDLEVAHSQAVDSEHLASFDGGITYGRVGSPDQFRAGRDDGWTPRTLEGWAAKLKLSGDVREIMDAVNDVPPAEATPPPALLPYTFYAQFQDPQFYAGSSILEQGQTKVGGTLRWVISEQDQVKLRHDGVWSELFFGEDRRTLNRQISAIGFEHDDDGWLAGAELGHTYSADADRRGHRDTLVAYGELDVSPRLTLLAEQEWFTEWGTSGASWASQQLIGDWTDQLATTVGARYDLAEELQITATESLRWSGTNSTQVGLKARFGEDFNIYLSERLIAGAGNRAVSTTVIGGESTAVPGSRSYAEYQLDALASGESGRAVFGMDNRWTLLEGLKLNLSYERSQLLGADGDQFAATGSSFDAPRAASAGSGPLAPDQQFSASGYVNGSVFPTGVSSRDAFALGLEYLPSSRLKTGARFEMRYDRGDRDFGTLDRLTLFGQAGGDWRFDRDFVLLSRLQAATVRNTDYDFTEGEFLDVSVGLALRPEDTDRYGGLFKWTRRYERRPVTEALTRFQLEVSDVVALEPYYELGAGFQLVGKTAVKLYEVLDADLPQLRSTTVLALARLNYHLHEMFDAGAEYRWLHNFLVDQTEHGALVEVAWIPVQYLSVGLGYNFTNFSDDLLVDPKIDQHGVFLRVTGRY